MEEIYDKLKKDRERAFERASIFARFADELETALNTISMCPCCEQFSCAEYAATKLEAARDTFNKEWAEYQRGNDDQEPL